MPKWGWTGLRTGDVIRFRFPTLLTTDQSTPAAGASASGRQIPDPMVYVALLRCAVRCSVLRALRLRPHLPLPLPLAMPLSPV